jgi:hypothetical protein
MGDAVNRNFERWPVLGQYVWPNYYVASTHQSEMNWMKKWIENRLWWLDANLPGNCGGILPPVVEGFEVSVYPNPVYSVINLDVASEHSFSIRFRLYNLNGALVDEHELSITQGEQTLGIGAESLPKGMYFYVLVKGYEPFQKGKLVKF